MRIGMFFYSRIPVAGELDKVQLELMKESCILVNEKYEVVGFDSKETSR